MFFTYVANVITSVITYVKKIKQMKHMTYVFTIVNCIQHMYKDFYIVCGCDYICDKY